MELPTPIRRFSRRTALAAWCALATACASRGPSTEEARTAPEEEVAVAPASAPGAGDTDAYSSAPEGAATGMPLWVMLAGGELAEAWRGRSETLHCVFYLDPNDRPSEPWRDDRSTLGNLGDWGRAIEAQRALIQDEAERVRFDALVAEPFREFRDRILGPGAGTSRP